MSRSRVLLLSFLISAFSSQLAHAQALECSDGPTCTPNQSGSSYSGAAAARPKILNARGYASPIVAKAAQGGAATNASGDVTIVGSQSYNYRIPILTLPGRAGMDLVLNLYYNSRVWDIDTVNATATFNADRDFPSYGFRLDFGYVEFVPGEFIVTEGDGTKHPLPAAQLPNFQLIYNSSDGTYINYNYQTNVLSYKNGTRVQYEPFPLHANLFRPISVKDTNGNFITISYKAGHDQLINQIIDTVGRTITFNYDANNRLISLSQSLHPSGSKTYVTFGWGTKYGDGTAWYNFSGLTPTAPDLNTAVNVLVGCTYANGTGYRFTYGDWGIIKKIEYLSSSSPAAVRSYVSYNYPSAAQAQTDAPAYTQQTVSPDGTDTNTSVWSYAATKNGTGVVTSMAVTDPNGNVSTTNLDATGLVSSVEVKDSSNITLGTIAYTWTTSGTGTSAGAGPVPSSITTTLGDTGQQSSVQYAYDSLGNPTTVSEYDFGSVLKRQTVSSYPASGGAGLGGQAFFGQHILHLPSQILIKDGNGNTVARTDLSYDSTALASVTGASNHDDGGYGASFTIRGNLAAVTRYSNAAAGTGGFTRNFNYDSLGNVVSAQMDCCNQKTFNFSSTTQYSAPDSVVRGPSGLQFTTSYSYNLDSGLLLSRTDENGQITSYTYDSMNRPAGTTLPPQGATSVQLNTAYDDTSASPAVATFSTANSAVSVATLDGLGHIMRVEKKNCTGDPLLCSTVVSRVTYGYDKLWQRTQASNPFVPGDSVINTAFSYDGLGRITRITPPTAGYAQFDYSGNSVTVTDPAGKQHKNYSDGLGRLSQVDEPGETFDGKALGNLNIGGMLRTTPLGTHSNGSFTVQGYVRSGTFQDCSLGECYDVFITDSGSLTVTVGGFPATAYYGTGSDATTVAADLAYQFNNIGNSPVWATPSGATVTLTSKQTGASTNYAVSTSNSTDYPQYFFGGSFTASIPSSLTGGTDNGGGTAYDSGTVTVSVGSTFTASAPYSQSGNSTAALVVAALVGTGATGLNRPGSPVTATAAGGSISFKYNTSGSTGNVTVAATSSPDNPSLFPGGSFNGSTTLAGGQTPYSSGLAHPYTTTYTYDTLDHLTAVSQATGLVNGVQVSGQARSYSYDSLGRLTVVTTPESGTVTNYYTKSNGTTCAGNPSLPCRVQDARGVMKNLTYDDINRLTGVQYTSDPANTPPVTYQYDTGGSAAFALDRLTKIIEGPATPTPVNSKTFAYDNLGRVTSVTHSIDQNSYIVGYIYNLASEVTTITYPSGRVVTQNYDAIGRISSIASGATTYLNNVTYNAAGETLGLTLGNGVTGAFTYNDHLELASLRYVKPGNSTDVLNLVYDYTSTAQTGNNGQIQKVHYFTSPGNEDLTKSESFTYDQLSRLSAAQTLSVSPSLPGTWSLAWTYDRLGNRLSQTLTGGNVSVGQPNLLIDANTNRIIGYCYDAAGNLTDTASCPGSNHQYAYDGANRLTNINTSAATYTYFGALRIKKVVGATTTRYVYSGTQVIAEYVNGSTTPSTEYIFSGSQLLATVSGSTTTYHHPDHLSNRAETDTTGAVVRTFGHFPYGENWYETLAADKWKLTSYERDSAVGETGLDYARFRYFSSGQGKFMSPDVVAGMVVMPQSLNRYSYVVNDPVNLTDPSGRNWFTGIFKAIWRWMNRETDGNIGGGGGGGGGSKWVDIELPSDEEAGGSGGDPVRGKVKLTATGPVLDCSPPDSPTRSADDLEPQINIAARYTGAEGDATRISGTASVVPSTPGESSSKDLRVTSGEKIKHQEPYGSLTVGYVLYSVPNMNEGGVQGKIDLDINVQVAYKGGIFGFDHETTFNFKVRVKIQCAHPPTVVVKEGGE